MLSVGLDIHKKHSRFEVIDEAGLRRGGARNESEKVKGFLGSLG